MNSREEVLRQFGAEPARWADYTLSLRQQLSQQAQLLSQKEQLLRQQEELLRQKEQMLQQADLDKAQLENILQRHKLKLPTI